MPNVSKQLWEMCSWEVIHNRKYRRMSIIPFPVCENAANHFREGRQLENISNYTEGRQLKIIKVK